MLRLCAAVALSLCVVGSAYGQQPTEPDPPVCDRTLQVRSNLAVQVGFSPANCSQVTLTHLEAVTQMSFIGSRISSLKSGDFNNLPNLQQLDLDDNQLQTLPADIFDDLPNLVFIVLERNPFSKGLPSAVISRLKSIGNAIIDLVAVNDILTTQNVSVGSTKNVELEDAFFYRRGLPSPRPASSYEITPADPTVAETQISGTHTLQITTLQEGQTEIEVVGIAIDWRATQTFTVTTEAANNIIFRIKVFLEGAQ